MISKITPCLWFDTQGEEAARFYVSIFKNSRIVEISYYPDAGKEVHGNDAGDVMLVSFELEGQSFTALNGGPQFKFTEAVSLQIECETQEEIDYYTEKLSEGGDPEAHQCGWVKDKFGLSWQVFPNIIPRIFMDADKEKSRRAFDAMLKMKKLDIAALKRAFEGVK